MVSQTLHPFRRVKIQNSGQPPNQWDQKWGWRWCQEGGTKEEVEEKQGELWTIAPEWKGTLHLAGTRLA